MSMIGDLTDRMEQHLYCLKKQCDNGFDYEDEISMVKEAITTIKDLSAKLSAANMERSGIYYNGGWIEFKQKYDESEKRYVFDCSLPKDGQRILISLNPKKGFENVQADMFYEDCGECYLDSGYEIMDDVLAWRPLPEPYKPKENE